MKLFPNDVLGIKPNDILDGKNRKRKDRYNKVQKQVDEAIDSLLEVSQEYYVTWSGPDQVPTYISISEESEEEAARVLVDNTSFLTQSMPYTDQKHVERRKILLMR